MKKNQVSFTAAISGIILLLFFSCNREEWFSNKTQRAGHEKNHELTTKTAREWYNSNGKTVSRIAAFTSARQGFLVTPSWNHAKEWKKDRYETVEVSLISNTNVFFFNNDILENKRSIPEKEREKIKNVGRAVILKDLETGEISTFNMIIVGSYKYLTQGKSSISDNNYLHRESDFDGVILFFSTEGKFINGWRYENGKITRQLSPLPEEEIAALQKRAPAKEAQGVDCYIDYEYYSYNSCSSSTKALNAPMKIYSSNEFGFGYDDSYG